jgi:hypothetical protein
MKRGLIKEAAGALNLFGADADKVERIPAVVRHL